MLTWKRSEQMDYLLFRLWEVHSECSTFLFLHLYPNVTQFLQGTKLTFLARSHLAPKFSKVVAKAKKLGAIKKNALYSNVKWKGFPSFEVKCLRNHLKGISN